jgi:phenylalanine-4-hydroxylase
MDDFNGFSNNDLSDNFTTNNLFGIYVSPTSDNIRITIFEEKTHTKMQQILKCMYHLEPTKDNTGITTTLTNKEVVIRLYDNTMTMLIQGTGCRIWLDTILEQNE